MGEESLHKNPWRFFRNGYWGALRDEHHGVWSIEEQNSNVILTINATSASGYHKYQLGPDGVFRNIGSTWGFLRSWNIQ